MKNTGTERGEVLVLRAWMEGNQTRALRVRVIRVTGSTEPMTAIAATVDGVCAIVQAWLEELLRSPGRPGSTTKPPPTR